MPAFRVTEYIAEALDSVLAQTFPDYEIIVVNDGCPDTVNLERVLQPYFGRIVYLKQENGGLASARNAGIRASRAPLLALLDPDDIWEPDNLEVQVGIMRNEPSIDVLYPNAVFFGDTPLAGRQFMAVCPSEGDVTFLRLLRGECEVFGNVMARREAIIRAGMYDPSLRSVEDYDLWLRITKQGGRIAYHRKPLQRYRMRQGNLSADSVWMHQNVLTVLNKVGVTMELTSEELDSLNEATRLRRALLDLELGRRAFFAGDTDAAYAHLDTANRYLRRKKLAVILVLLRHAPSLLHRISLFRERHASPFSTKSKVA
jgi:glycosyltransferase involved in cell wall biosynthesis